MKTNKFRLILDGKYTFYLTVNNYAKIIGNHGLVSAIDIMIFDMKQAKVYGMVSNTSGYAIQINFI
jgi:hypothetical protein